MPIDDLELQLQVQIMLNELYSEYDQEREKKAMMVLFRKGEIFFPHRYDEQAVVIDVPPVGVPKYDKTKN